MTFISLYDIIKKTIIQEGISYAEIKNQGYDFDGNVYRTVGNRSFYPPLVPFTLQTMFTCMAGLILGKKKGGLSVALYVILGLVGLPIFTKGGGPQYVFETTFGYLIGFAVGAYVTGAIAHAKENPSLKRLICAAMVNLVIVYAFGSVYGYIILNYVNHVQYGAVQVLMAFALPFIPADVVTSLFAAILAKKLLPVLEKQFSLSY